MKRLRLQPGRAHGFTLAELLVAITIGLIVLGGATTVMVHSNKNFKVQNDLARIQENARFAMEFLTRDIRMAGYFGCIDEAGEVWDHVVGGAGDLFDTDNPIQGSESAGNWQPDNTPAPPANMVADTDGITLRFLDPSTAINVETPYMGQPSGVLHVASPNNLNPAEIVAVTDCASTDIIQITTGNPGNTGTVGHGTGGNVTPGNTDAHVPGCPGSNQHCLSKVYEGEAQILKLVARRYFIGTTGNGTTALIRQTLDPAGGVGIVDQEMVEGIESLQILYGEDLSGDSIPDQYADASSVGNWAGVVAVRVGLLASSIDELGTRFEEDHDDYDIDSDGTVDLPDPGDRRRRRVFAQTILMRNLQ